MDSGGSTWIVPFDESKPRWGLHPFQVAVALAAAALSGVAWALGSTAGSTVLGRLGMGLAGVGMGQMFGLLVGHNYLHGRPSTRRRWRNAGYAWGILLVALLLEDVEMSIALPAAVAGFCLIPTTWIWAKHRFLEDGDRTISRYLSLLTVAGFALLIGVASASAVVRTLTAGGIVWLLIAAAARDRRSRNERMRRGELEALPSHRKASGWRLRLRVVGALLCIAIGVGGLLASRADASTCGTSADAVDPATGRDCRQGQGFVVTLEVAALVGGGALGWGAVRGRLYAEGSSRSTEPLADEM